MKNKLELNKIRSIKIFWGSVDQKEKNGTLKRSLSCSSVYQYTFSEECVEISSWNSGQILKSPLRWSYENIKLLSQRNKKYSRICCEIFDPRKGISPSRVFPVNTESKTLVPSNIKVNETALVKQTLCKAYILHTYPTYNFVRNPLCASSTRTWPFFL